MRALVFESPTSGDPGGRGPPATLGGRGHGGDGAGRHRGHFHELQLRDVVQAILERREPAVRGSDGRATVELMAAIYEAQATGLPVRLTPYAG